MGVTGLSRTGCMDPFAFGLRILFQQLSLTAVAYLKQGKALRTVLPATGSVTCVIPRGETEAQSLCDHHRTSADSEEQKVGPLTCWVGSFLQEDGSSGLLPCSQHQHTSLSVMLLLLP